MAANSTVPSLTDVFNALRGQIDQYGTPGNPLRVYLGYIGDEEFANLTVPNQTQYQGVEIFGWERVDANGQPSSSGDRYAFNGALIPSLSTITNPTDPALQQKYLDVRNAVEAAKSLWAAANIVWVFSVNDPRDAAIWVGLRDFAFDQASEEPAGTGSLPRPNGTSGNNGLIFINSNDNQYSPPSNDPTMSFGRRYTFSTIVHEIGHTLGLGHPITIPADYTNSVMVGSNTRTSLDNNFVPIAPMLFDVAAIQSTYGANLSMRLDPTQDGPAQIAVDGGSTTYTFLRSEELANRMRFGVIWDPNGVDTIDASALNNHSYISLVPGTFSAIGAYSERERNSPSGLPSNATARDRNIAVAYRIDGLAAGDGWIENASGGSGNDVLIGNDVANKLEGNGGNDELRGGAGADTLYGERDPVQQFNGNAGDDTLDGGVAADAGTGTVGKGKGDALSDTLFGGEGADTYVIHEDTVADVIQDFGVGDRLEFHDLNDRIVPHEKVGYRDDATPGTPWISPTGQWRFTQNSPLTITDTQTGTSVVLGEDVDAFQDGDFGIHLLDEPGSDTAPTNFVNGTDSNNSLQGDPGGVPTPDEIHGFLGDDVLDGEEGEDRLFGDEGRDFIYGGFGDDLLQGGTDGDVLLATNDNDVVVGEALINDDLAATMLAAIDSDATPPGLIKEFLGGGAGNDIVIGGTGNDAIFGGLGIDTLIADAGDDTIWGDSEFIATSLNWSIDNNQYVDVVDSGIPASLGGDDAIYAGGGDDGVSAEAGDDYVDTGAGNDHAYGHEGNDAIFGGAGDDILAGDLLVGDEAHPMTDDQHGDDHLDGEDGDDELVGNGGADVLFGGAGNDLLFGDDDTVGLAYQGDDYLDGEDGNDQLLGGGGADELFGGTGVDTLFGGLGDDYLDGEEDNDQVLAGEGDDIAYGGEGDDTLFGEAGIDLLDGEDGNDTALAAAGDDVLMGGLGMDTLSGGSGDDELDGGDDADNLFGDADDAGAGTQGNDVIDGGAGNDSIVGGGGVDILNGGDGDDQMWGDADEVAAADHAADLMSGGLAACRTYPTEMIGVSGTIR